MPLTEIGVLGGTGLIGNHLTQTALAKGYKVRFFSRSGKGPSHPNLEIIKAEVPSTDQLENLHAIVNLVGEPIAGVRWSEEKKIKIRESRVDFTKALVSQTMTCQNPPSVFLQGSAVGYYGMSEKEHSPFSEDHSPGNEYLADLCVDWEMETRALTFKKIRTVVIRTGIVLSKNGGALAKMLLPFQMGVGGPIGKGQQGMSWIHETDMTNALLYLIENNKAEGPFNLVGPNPISNRQFARAIGKVLSRPSFLPVPEFAMNALFGEGSVVVTQGQYVVPTKLLGLGYSFAFPEIEEALREILKTKQ